jgi:hypothetical protein
VSARDEPEAADQYTARQISACPGWREELGVTPGKIEVAEFELTPPLPFVCLEQFDDWMREVLHGWDESDGATEEEQRRRDSVRSWQEERAACLHIEGGEYYIQSGGGRCLREADRVLPGRSPEAVQGTSPIGESGE